MPPTVTAPPPLPTIVVEAGARIHLLSRTFCHVEGDPRFSIAADGALVLDPHGLGARAELLYGDCQAPHLAALGGVGSFARHTEEADLAPDRSMIELRGPHLTQRTIWWRLGRVGRFEESALVDTVSEGKETLVATLPADVVGRATQPGEGPLELLLPPDGMPSPELPSVELWDRHGASVPLEAFRLPLGKILLDRSPVHDGPINGWRERAEVAIRWPGTVASASCADEDCRLSGDGSVVVVSSVPAEGSELELSLRLAPRVMLRGPHGLSAQTTADVPLARCQVKPLVPVILSGLADHRVPIQLDGDCPSDLSSLTVETVPVSQATVVATDGPHRLDLSLGLVPRGAQVLHLTLRAGPRQAVVGTAKIPMTDSWSFTRATLTDREIGDVDVIPMNRPVEVKVLAQDYRMSAALTVEPLPGFYRVLPGTPGTNHTLIEGGAETGGSVPILVGYRPPEAHLAPDAPPLVVFQALPGYQIHEVSVPVPLAPEHPGPRPFLQIICHDPTGAEHLIAQGQVINLPHDSRHSCRLSIDKTVLGPENGPQRLRLSITMTHPDTTPAPGGFSKVFQVRPGPGGDSIWLDPSVSVHEFDHMRVTLAHDDPGHFYLGSSDSLTGAGFTALSVEIIFGNRINGPEAGAIDFSAGALIRLALLDKRGVEFPIDGEFGIFGTGISQQANLSFVLGPGLTVPILNPGQAAQASVGIHAWLEYSPTITNPSGPTHIWNQIAVIFGPSVSIGDFGANF